ncbi:hypothetical protein [Botrimarina hoheduenensis]|uniref:Uncharacterized protein n=1 Tax=Botrimarina hoheduenensis TaxID=2528000 RepID=A0A5C5WE42_9BACT|nr:hypothetical protein [Botrimarina hoheduenensis]TWT48329.1 hypothetical protein Pla111_00920 [Botrimarina hoheduenensis]
MDGYSDEFDHDFDDDFSSEMSADEDLDPTDSSPAEAEYAWRETYFVLMRADDRPTLTQVEATLSETGGRRWTIENLRADEDGLFESLLVRAPDDHSALEVRFEWGDSVQEQAMELATSLKKQLTPDDLAQLIRADARLDVLHLEQLSRGGLNDTPEGSDPDELEMLSEGLDPGTLLMVVAALAKLTDGLPFDPAAGEVLT